MNDHPNSGGEFAQASHDQVMSALFANMVMQTTNMALMLLGRIPHPETGQTVQDVEGARMFIDQLEMIECKTKGNLNKQEERLLKESLTGLRMSFVEVVDAQAKSGPSEKTAGAPPAPPKSPASPPVATPGPASTIPAASEEESHKKFTKKY